MSSAIIAQISKVPPPAVEVYAEDIQQREINDGDIEVFATLIGINVEKEPNLRHIAEEGLLAPLPPGWKPCREATKNQWYYHNSATGQSQWEHPLNQIYREKVLQVRQDLAMNRIQSLELDPISSRPLTVKNLPPVRKFGAGGGRPPSSIGSRLGSIGGPLPPPTNKLDDHLSLNNNISESLSDLNKELDAYDREQDNYGLPPPSSRMVKKPSSPSSGLLLTGGGANFLKSSSVSKGEEANATSTSIKSILSHNKDVEKKLLSELNIPLKDRPAVKFKLDENPKLVFEPVENEPTEIIPNRKVLIGPMNKPTEESDETEESSHSFSQSETQEQGRQIKEKLDGGGAGEKINPPNLTNRKQTLRQNMDAELKKFQLKLEEERKQRESQINKQTETILEEIRTEKEALVKKLRQDLENQKSIELDKVKRDLELMVKIESDKLKIILDKELENKKAEIKSQHEMAMSVISQDVESLSDSQKAEALQQKLSESSTQLNAELKVKKDALREEQRKQIQHMKDYHQTFIEKLKKDLHTEELKIQAEHKKKITEVTKKFAKETADLNQKLKAEQDAKMKALKADFDKEKGAIEQELKIGISSLTNELNSLRSGVNANLLDDTSTEKSTPTKDSKDAEVKALNQKYEQLEKKYSYLKKELKKLTESATLRHNKNTQHNKPRPTSSKTKVVEEPEKKSKKLRKNAASQNIVEVELIPIETASPSVSESESTFYPSSSNQNQGQQNEEDCSQAVPISPVKNDQVLQLEENDDRLACALKSLEILKLQILEIQKSRPNSGTSGSKSRIKKVSSATAISAENPIPSSNQKSTSSKSNKPQNQRRVGGINKNNKLRPSKSASELPGLIEAADSEQDFDRDSPSPQGIVQEAKEFIRVQKERLNLQTPPSRPQFLHYQDPQPFLNYHPKSSVPSRLVEGLYSETESSGVGSMSFVNKDLKSNQKKKISKDIEAICSSLSNLDEQMKMMWSVVNSNQKVPNTPRNNSLDLQSFSGMTLPIRNNQNSYHLIPTVSSSHHQPPLARLTPSNLLNSLDKELQEFKATKERILSQFSTPRNNNAISGMGDSSLQDKTKDLREWLEKF